mgnify:CR=1 FL=1
MKVCSARMTHHCANLEAAGNGFDVGRIPSDVGLDVCLRDGGAGRGGAHRIVKVVHLEHANGSESFSLPRKSDVC